MAKKIARGIGIFLLFFLPPVLLSFLAYTVFHQAVLFVSALIALWVAFYGVKILAERDRLNREVFLQAYELKKAKETLDSAWLLKPKRRLIINAT